jgi:uncharacterized Fe-S cluster-containing radical SAM superfamily enzyme
MAMVLLTGIRKGESVAVNADRVTWIAEQRTARRTQLTICFDRGNTIKVQGSMPEVVAALERHTTA